MLNIFRQTSTALSAKEIAPDLLCTCFVAQTGGLAINAALLALSLRETHGTMLQILAGVPNQAADCGSLKEEEVALLEALDVQLIEIENPISSDYKVANKIGCLDKALEVTNRPYLAFLDSDIVCLAPICSPISEEWDVAVKPVDIANRGKNKGVWKKLYEICNTKMPNKYLQATVTGERMLPYYNSGFILIKTAQAGNFGRYWATIAQKCYAAKQDNPDIIIGDESSLSPMKRIINIDQFSLPIAIQSLDLRTYILDERWNFPLNFRSAIPSDTMIVHYHNTESFFAVPVLRELWFYACHKYPNFLQLAESIKNTDEHRAVMLLRCYPIKQSKLVRQEFTRDDGKGIPPGTQQRKLFSKTISKIRTLLRRNHLIYKLYLKLKPKTKV